MSTSPLPYRQTSTTPLKLLVKLDTVAYSQLLTGIILLKLCREWLLTPSRVFISTVSPSMLLLALTARGWNGQCPELDGHMSIKGKEYQLSTAEDLLIMHSPSARYHGQQAQYDQFAAGQSSAFQAAGQKEGYATPQQPQSTFQSITQPTQGDQHSPDATVGAHDLPSFRNGSSPFPPTDYNNPYNFQTLRDPAPVSSTQSASTSFSEDDCGTEMDTSPSYGIQLKYEPVPAAAGLVNQEYHPHQQPMAGGNMQSHNGGQLGFRPY